MKASSVQYEMYLIEPDDGSDPHSLACMLAKRQGVAEVVVTEGRYGMLVKSQADNGLERFLSNNVTKRFSKVTGRYRYRR